MTKPSFICFTLNLALDPPRCPQSAQNRNLQAGNHEDPVHTDLSVCLANRKDKFCVLGSSSQKTVKTSQARHLRKRLWQDLREITLSDIFLNRHSWKISINSPSFCLLWHLKPPTPETDLNEQGSLNMAYTLHGPSYFTSGQVPKGQAAWGTSGAWRG